MRDDLTYEQIKTRLEELSMLGISDRFLVDTMGGCALANLFDLGDVDAILKKQDELKKSVLYFRIQLAAAKDDLGRRRYERALHLYESLYDDIDDLTHGHHDP